MALPVIAGELATAERTCVPIKPITDRFEAFDVVAAYRVQSLNVQRRLARGESLIGHKVGLTNRAMQQQLGVDEPDFGRLLSDMRVDAGADIPVSHLIQPRVEPEICFFIGRDLVGPGISRADVLSATDALGPALEIIDSRIADWQIRLPDTVADNASCGRVVVGAPHAAADVDLMATVGRLYRDDDVVGTGRGADVLGDPAAAVAWLANKLAAFGESLTAGAIVIPGALCASVPLTAGSTYRAEIDGIGSVAVQAVA